jgi:SAM-dependent methyltransferase
MTELPQPVSSEPVPMNHTHEGGENLEVMREARNYNRFLRNLIRRYAGKTETALDFGAGIGTFSGSLDLPVDCVHCVEPDRNSRVALAEQGFHAHAGLSDLTDATVSYAFSLNVLEHIEDDAGAMDDLYRVIKPGGRLFLYVPAFMLLFTSMDRHVGHHRRYRLGELAHLVEDAGFTIEKKAYTDALGFFATLLFRLLDDGDPGELNPRLIRMYDRFCFPLSRVLSLLFARVLGKNAYVVATRPAC